MTDLDDVIADQAIESMYPEDRAHKFVTDATGYPEYSGHCAVYAVCEDCGEELGRIGTDSVL